MEESAQILEIETFIPMLLQNTEEKEGSRLKRVILIGDHNQLPPIVKSIPLLFFGQASFSLCVISLCFPSLMHVCFGP